MKGRGRPTLTLRQQRLKLTWVLAAPFIFLARPTPGLLLAGAVVALPGLILRGWAAGCIHKDVYLATSGPYGLLRHPLYVGSFLVGLGLVTASGRWPFLLLYLLLFPWLYGRTIRAEERLLVSRFGGSYRLYRSRVPGFLPRGRVRGSLPWPEGDPPPGPDGFRIHLYRRNREWEALLGAMAGFCLLALRMSAPF